MSKRINLTGRVVFNGMMQEKRILLIEPDQNEIQELEEEIRNEFPKVSGTPIKEGTENNEGKFLFKTQSKYSVNIYDNGVMVDMDISEIGVDSNVTVNVKLDETAYRGKKHLCAYLKAVNILDLVEGTDYNPFV